MRRLENFVAALERGDVGPENELAALEHAVATEDGDGDRGGVGSLERDPIFVERLRRRVVGGCKHVMVELALAENLETKFRVAVVNDDNDQIAELLVAYLNAP